MACSRATLLGSSRSEGSSKGHTVIMGAGSLNRVYRRGLNVRAPQTSEVATRSKKFLFIIQSGGGTIMSLGRTKCSDYIYFHWSITSRGLGATPLAFFIRDLSGKEPVRSRPPRVLTPFRENSFAEQTVFMLINLMQHLWRMDGRRGYRQHSRMAGTRPSFHLTGIRFPDVDEPLRPRWPL